MHIKEFSLSNDLDTYNITECDAIIINPDEYYIINPDEYYDEPNMYQMSDCLKNFLKDQKIAVIFMPNTIDEMRYLQELFFNLGIDISFELKFGNKVQFSDKYQALGYRKHSFTTYIGTEYSYYPKITEYKSIITSPVEKSICWVENNRKQTLGAEFNYDKGKVILYPTCNHPNFFQDLNGFLLKYNIWEKNTENLPSWTNQYILPVEQKYRNEIENKEQNIVDLQIQINEIQEKLDIEEQNKVLFTGTDKSLEKQVGIVLEKIGFTVETPDNNRVDHIITYHNKIAVIEVKGLSGSAQEKNASQLEKWHTEYRMEYPDMPYPQPKPILIVNAYRNLPLNERNEKAYPDQMLAYACDRKQCLMTGIQLYNIYYYLQLNKDQTEHIIQKIFDTTGCFDGFDDLSLFIPS